MRRPRYPWVRIQYGQNRVGLPTLGSFAATRLPTPLGSDKCAGLVPDHGGGSVPDLHRLPGKCPDGHFHPAGEVLYGAWGACQAG